MGASPALLFAPAITDAPARREASATESASSSAVRYPGEAKLEDVERVSVATALSKTKEKQDRTVSKAERQAREKDTGVGEQAQLDDTFQTEQAVLIVRPKPADRQTAHFVQAALLKRTRKDARKKAPIAKHGFGAADRIHNANSRAKALVVGGGTQRALDKGKRRTMQASTEGADTERLDKPIITFGANVDIAKQDKLKSALAAQIDNTNAQMDSTVRRLHAHEVSKQLQAVVGVIEGLRNAVNETEPQTAPSLRAHFTSRIKVMHKQLLGLRIKLTPYLQEVNSGGTAGTSNDAEDGIASNHEHEQLVASVPEYADLETLTAALEAQNAALIQELSKTKLEQAPLTSKTVPDSFHHLPGFIGAELEKSIRFDPLFVYFAKLENASPARYAAVQAEYAKQRTMVRDIKAAKLVRDVDAFDRAVSRVHEI